MSALILIAVLLPIIAGITLLLVKTKREGLLRTVALASVTLTSLTVCAVIVYCRGCELTLMRFSDVLSFAMRVDGVGMFFAGMVAFLWPFAMYYTFVYLQHDEKRKTYYGFYVATYGVVLGIAFAANALTLYVFYELLTFITLPLITHTQTKEARKAGRMYLYYSLSGSSLALAGIVILIVTTGTSAFIPGGVMPYDISLARFAYTLTFIGFGVKAAIFPLCRWLPIASAAPTPTTALLHAVAVVKAGAFSVIRITYFYCPVTIIRDTYAQYIAVAIAAFTVLYGSCMALKEQHLKRRYAYSTVSNLSYILLGALLCTQSGLQAALTHFIMHSVTKIGIFFCCGAIIETTGAQYVYQLNGMGKKAPLVFVCYTISGLSLIGIPPLCGFVSKYYLISSSLSSVGICGYIAVGAIIASAVLTAAYTLSVSVRAFVRQPNALSADIYANAKEPQKGFIAVTAVFAFVTLAFGLFGGGIVDIINGIAGGITL